MNERASEKLKRDLKSLKENLIQEKDEIRVQVELAKMEARTEWKKIENQLEDFLGKVKSNIEQAETATEDTVKRALNLGSDLKKRIKDAKDKLKDSMEV